MVTLKNFFSFKNNRFFWLNIIAMIIVIVVAVFGTLWGLYLYTHHGESYVVPNVKNKNLDQAQLLLNQQFMQGIVIDSNYVKFVNCCYISPDCLPELYSTRLLPVA